jgi:hypothetical protein
MKLISLLSTFWEKIKSTYWFEFLFLTIISGLVYAPRFGQLTFQKDDWYFIYDGLVGGPKFYLDLTLHTRPARGPLYEFLFSLFNIHPFPYHVTLYFWRLLGGFGALWLFNLLWPKHRRANFFAAVLFLVFPGFLWWLGAFEFQPYVLSLTLQVFSIVFTIKAFESSSTWKRITWMVIAILLGWVYLSLVEYAIGMEFFRFLCMYLWVKREFPQLNFSRVFLKTLRAIALFWIIPLGFILWYQFFFDNWRRAQEAGVQIGQLFSSPLTMFWWLFRLFQSTLNVSLLAWAVPFQENFLASPNRLSDILIAFFFAALTILFVALANRSLGGDADAEDEKIEFRKWQLEMLLVGFLGTFVGVFPIVVANRFVQFENYSHYALPASLAGVVFLSGLIHSIFPKNIRLFVLLSLIGIAALTHNAVAAQAVNEEQTVSNFWWQVTWRAPSISTNTTLVVVYPNVDYADGDEVVWGPANSIYYPAKQNQAPIVVPISASRMEPASITNIVMGPKDMQITDLIIKDVTLNYHFRNVLLMTQPSAESCVHAIDQKWPELSTFDDAFAIASSSKSNIDNIIPTGIAPRPPQVLFGNEPSHGWCYYYQKAELARQQGNWDEIVKLGDEAQKLGFHPNDLLEWMPFLQAYAYLDDLKHVQDVSKKIDTVNFYQSQACQILTSMNKNGYLLRPDMVNLVNGLFCQSKK